MMAVMTDTTPEQPTETPADAELPAPPDRRWNKSHRRGGRPFRLAAFVVTVAGVVFIVAVIFWSGFILGASERGEGDHHGDGERGSSQESGGSEQDNGMTPHGVVIERVMPPAAFTG
jgi:hypothetical protein